MSSLPTHNSKSSSNVYFWKAYILPVKFQVTKVTYIVEAFKLLAVVLGPLLCAVVILVFWAVSAGILKEQTSILGCVPLNQNDEPFSTTLLFVCT
jgi:hypothetical protein